LEWIASRIDAGNWRTVRGLRTQQFGGREMGNSTDQDIWEAFVVSNAFREEGEGLPCLGDLPGCVVRTLR
jgi:hypothetical protein